MRPVFMSLFRDDVVPAINSFCAMTRDAHRDISRDSRAFHVANCGAPQVVELEIGKQGTLAGISPAFQMRANRPIVLMEDVRTLRPILLPV